ncbi:hypothetical protein [Spirosoma panaciterrae]|uniref:hypothetical protein n=1 Tax=Spirosoma panaciterrae TaxID=496058 RepID=UPI0003A2FF97|nr:hypothetical protein [Spirosoma panaciterrae]
MESPKAKLKKSGIYQLRRTDHSGSGTNQTLGRKSKAGAGLLPKKGNRLHYKLIHRSIRNIVENNYTEIAFIVGNGINRYPNNPLAISWEDLLIRLWQEFSPEAYNQVPEGITLTEFYDLLEISAGDSRTTNFQIQKRASEILSDWTFLDHHTAFVDKAYRINAPILTTNFDLILPKSVHYRGVKQYYTDTKKFTDFYPWTTYYGGSQLDFPTDGFGIWFINGFVNYHRSIRLGLTHYMGSVEKARNLLHKGDDNKLFSGKNQSNWRGANTWLHIIFNKSLCIFGLGMEENEVFIRWLLIERAKYFKKFPERRKKGWYIDKKYVEQTNRLVGKYKFLQSIGLEIVEVENYDDIYKYPW